LLYIDILSRIHFTLWWRELLLNFNPSTEFSLIRQLAEKDSEQAFKFSFEL